MEETRSQKTGGKGLTRVALIETEFRRKYPRMVVRKELFEIVGTEKRSSLSKDRNLIRQIVAERYE